MTRAAIDTTALVKMVYTSLLASIAVAVIFSVALLGAIRATDNRRAHRNAAAIAYGIVAASGLALAAGIVVYGLTLIIHKS
jgi:hypothetical protein